MDVLARTSMHTQIRNILRKIYGFRDHNQFYPITLEAQRSSFIPSERAISSQHRYHITSKRDNETINVEVSNLIGFTNEGI